MQMLPGAGPIVEPTAVRVMPAAVAVVRVRAMLVLAPQQAAMHLPVAVLGDVPVAALAVALQHVEKAAHKDLPANMPTDPILETGSSFVQRIPLSLGLGVIAVVAIAVWYVYGVQQNRPLNQALGALESGNFGEAAQKAQMLKSLAEGNRTEYQNAQSIVRASQFFAGGGIDAVTTAKQQFASASGDPETQAAIVNVLIGYAESTGDPQMLAEIFRDPPFYSLYVNTSVTDSIRNLGQFSLSLATTSGALYAVGNWHGTQILKHLDGMKKLSKAQMQSHVRAIQNILAETELLYASEAASQSVYALGSLYDPTFYFSRGHLYGILSLLDTSFLPTSEASFTKVASSNPDSVLLMPRIPYAHLEMAILIKEAGSSRETDVKMHLDALMSFIASNAAMHQNFFIAFIRSLGQHDLPLLLTNQKRIRELAAVHPPFREFLQQNGWTEEDFSL